MDYFRSLLPNSIPVAIDSSDDLKIWQERSLHYLLLGGSVLGSILVIASYSVAITSRNWTMFFGSILLTFVSLGLSTARRYSYWARSVVELATLYLFANILFTYNGWSGVSLTVLLGFSFLSTILLYRTPTRIGLGISVVTVFIWIFIQQNNLISVGSASNSLALIISDLAIVFIVGFLGNFAIFSLKINIINMRQELIKAKSNQIELTEKISNQSSSLEKRVFQLRTASEIAQKVSSNLDPDVLIQQVADLLRERFNLYFVGVYLIDNDREYAVLKYGTGEAGKRLRATKHRLAVGGYSMIGWVTQTRKPRVAIDVGNEIVHFDNPFLPNTHSELALPIISGANVLGAFSIQSELVNAFDENDVLILQSVVDNIGTALENANLFKRTQNALEEIRILNKNYTQRSWWDTLDNSIVNKFEYENTNAPVLSTKHTAMPIPIKIRDEIIGQYLIEAEDDTLTKDQIDFIQAISNQTSIALENARLFSETQRAALQEQMINELTGRFSNILTIEEIIKTAVIEFGKLPLVKEASISLLPPDESSSILLLNRESNDE